MNFVPSSSLNGPQSLKVLSLRENRIGKLVFSSSITVLLKSQKVPNFVDIFSDLKVSVGFRITKDLIQKKSINSYVSLYTIIYYNFLLQSNHRHVVTNEIKGYIFLKFTKIHKCIFQLHIYMYILISPVHLSKSRITLPSYLQPIHTYTYIYIASNIVYYVRLISGTIRQATFVSQKTLEEIDLHGKMNSTIK